MIEQALEKLNRLRESTPWHESVMGTFDMWQKQLENIDEDDNFLELPRVKKLAADLAARLKNIDEELRTNRTLPQEQRSYLFALKDAYEIELAVFSKENIVNTIRGIEQEIDYQLETFSSEKHESGSVE